MLPLVIDREAEADERRLAIRSLGASGYTWWADLLVDLLEDGDNPMQDEARAALQAISGAGRADADTWRRWLETVPTRPERKSATQ